MGGGEKRVMITVDDDGSVQTSKAERGSGAVRRVAGLMPSRPRPATPPKRKHYPRRQPEVGSYTTAAWRSLRVRILLRDPICMARGCHRPSEVADHITPRRQGGTDSESNLQGLCKRCHGRITNRFDGGWGNRVKAGKAEVA